MYLQEGYLKTSPWYRIFLSSCLISQNLKHRTIKNICCSSGFCTMQTHQQIPTFQRNILTPSSRHLSTSLHGTKIQKNIIIMVLTEDDCLLGCCTVQSGRSLPTFHRFLLPPSSRWWDYTMQQPSRQPLSYLPPWEPEISHVTYCFTRWKNVVWWKNRGWKCFKAK
jgi:hypothetical protein